jgi:benzoyl-CoA reductase/2-hydroxyglutaryl-CoA dehydratase subunit BcrC/BadD/HgdB
MGTTAIATLTAAFGERFANPGQPADRARPSVVLSWPSVPIEIVRAAGLRPLVARGGPTATPAADAHLEPEIFPSRLRHLVDAALTGRLSRAVGIVVPRTSDPDYKCFLYLREFVRLGVVKTLPPTILFDLLQSNGPEVRAYDVGRTRALFEELALATGREPSLDDIREEIVQTNAARAAARRLADLRRGTPRITGAEAFPLLGAFWQLPPTEYATLAIKAADDIERHAPLGGPRVMLAGAPVDGPALHTQIESHGAIVVAEVGPWGSGAAADDVVCDDDPMTALADKYRADSIGARTPVDALKGRMAHALDAIDAAIDAVVVSLPPEDTAFGWDYPALRDLLQDRRIPHICLHGDPHRPLAAEDHERLDTMMNRAASWREARHA